MNTDKIRKSLSDSRVKEPDILRYLYDALYEIDGLRSQLKACREREKGEITEIEDYFTKEVEQRTKEECFQAGWKWIVKRFDNGRLLLDDDDLDFKRAIEGA